MPCVECMRRLGPVARCDEHPYGVVVMRRGEVAVRSEVVPVPSAVAPVVPRSIPVRVTFGANVSRWTPLTGVMKRSWAGQTVSPRRVLPRPEFVNPNRPEPAWWETDVPKGCY